MNHVKRFGAGFLGMALGYLVADYLTATYRIKVEVRPRLSAHAARTLEKALAEEKAVSLMRDEIDADIAQILSAAEQPSAHADFAGSIPDESPYSMRGRSPLRTPYARWRAAGVSDETMSLSLSGVLDKWRKASEQGREEGDGETEG